MNSLKNLFERPSDFEEKIVWEKEEK